MSTRRTILKLMVAAVVAGSENAYAQGERLALKGYDPVAYFTDAKATPGLAEFEYSWDGQRYRFASARHRDMFRANPEKYAPQFGGSCAMNMSSGVRRESDPHNWVISNGNLYVFAGTSGMETFLNNPDIATTRAAANWPTLKNTATR